MGPAIALDLTELAETDDLRDPVGVINEAQSLAAEHFGASRTWFLVNGASAGNQAALLAIGAIGRKVVIDRNAHSSLVAGLVLAGLEPVWVRGDWDAAWGIGLALPAAAIGAALTAHPDACAVVVTSPTYFGDAADLRAIRAVAGDRVLLVDEAHGAHLPRALAAGADLVVHSAHKGLSGPTQGGYLHLSGSRIDAGAVGAAIELVQTSSPNYWLLSGLDAARRAAAMAARLGAGLKGAAPIGIGPTGDSSRALSVTRLGSALQGASENSPWPVIVRISDDPSRVLVRFSDGFAAYEALAESGLVAEAALPNAVLLFLGQSVNDEAVMRKAVAQVAKVAAAEGKRQPLAELGPPPIAEMVMDPRRAAIGPSAEVEPQDAIDKISAVAMAPYPPGVPVIVPGERVTTKILAYLTRAGSRPAVTRVVRD